MFSSSATVEHVTRVGGTACASVVHCKPRGLLPEFDGYKKNGSYRRVLEQVHDIHRWFIDTLFLLDVESQLMISHYGLLTTGIYRPTRRHQ